MTRPTPEPERDPERDRDAAPSDAELAGLESALASALGGARAPSDRGAQGKAGSPGNTGAPDGSVLAAFGDPRPQSATPARPSFRSSLRASFVAGRFEGDGAPPAVVARALDAAVAQTPRAEFRADLRARFLAARAEEPPVAPARLLGAGVAAEVPPPGAAGRARARRGGRAAEEREPRARRWPRYGIVAALAAGLLAAVLLRGQLGWPDGGGGVRWTMFDASPLTGLLVDGAPVTDRAALEARLAAGAALETGAEGLRLAVGRDLVIDLGPGTRARVPAYSAARTLTFELERGALRIGLGPGAERAGTGRRLVVVTPHLEAVAVGTVFGVDCTAQLTCVCCIEGEALMRSLLAGGAEGRVAAGRARVVFADGRALEHEVVPAHRAPLDALREAWRT